MDTTLTQRNMPNPEAAPVVFASDPEAFIGKPGSPYYDEGVQVRYTAPGNWWNWLWNTVSSWLKNHKVDNQNMLTEESNLLSAAGITPSSSESNQLGKSFKTISVNNAGDYDNETVTEEGLTHPVNRPYVSGSKIILPDTELL